MAGAAGSVVRLMRVPIVGAAAVAAMAGTGCSVDAGRADRTGGGVTVQSETTPAVEGGAASSDANATFDGDTHVGLLGHTVTSIDGEPVALSDYAGEVILIVNTASRCGFTPQYEGLQALYSEQRDRGFVVLGFPANNFGGQEPGSDEQIAAFCDREFGVTFPMFSKVSVIGEDQHPLFADLAAASQAPEWNFTKYLIGRDGRFVDRFGPRVSPSDKALRAEIERLLAEG